MTDCKHNFIAEKVKKQKRIKEYLIDGKYDVATIENEDIIIFCQNCGEKK